MPQEAEPATPQSSDVTRRTWLAAERTWLAWGAPGSARPRWRSASADVVFVSLGALVLVAIRL